MSDDDIERSAAVADDVAQELRDRKPKPGSGRYDREAPRRIDFAIRIAQRIASRIRLLASVPLDDPGRDKDRQD